MDVYLETGRLLLRQFTPDDVDALFELDSDPRVRRFVEDGQPVSRADIAEHTIPAFLAYYERDDGFGFWAAIEKASGRFIGWFHFRPPPDGDRCDPELGYRLLPWAWGKGYATEGSLALVDKGFAELGVERVYAETMAVNTASRRVMEKCGMRLVRSFHADWPVRIPGDEHGDVEYAITRAEWEAARQA